VLLTATDFVCLAGAQLQEVLGTFWSRGPGRASGVVLDDSPVRVVLANWCVDLEPAGEFDEQLDVFSLVELFGERLFASDS